MIRIGLTSFSEHDTLTGKKKSSLFEYAGFLPLVELDTSFYGIPAAKTVENWLTQVPQTFRFIIKLPSPLTKQKDLAPEESLQEIYQQFLKVMAPIIKNGQLYCFLAQFPAQFKLTKENVRYLEELREMFQELPIAVELRDASWYAEGFHDKTMALMKKLEYSLVMVDEPKLLDTVPLDLTITNPEFVLFRFHGRNQTFWKDNSPEWRKKRTLYRYNQTELNDLAKKIQQVAAEVDEVAIIFNNNSGGDAAGNALTLKEILNLDYQALNPSQLGLF
ncbi:DUF72 domain-containing protein [Enterococcus alishanensis]|uniref:DUF72 domain-containing protein n=1 Tax=Enterococcus alishanensis TaxID=1303817 RepID=A0ABS6T7E8_9ENTE|nr:DUF72 domain-containing protein [Enterococcus alishanensis]MBV7389064.1 DUF72 domain-containing protein [Enterococcus alishanensis]